MHEEYYGFSEKPFSLTPDPKYLYKSESHANAFDLLQQRPAQRGFSSADVAGDDDEAFAAADGVLQQIECIPVRLASIEILRIRRQAERLLGKSVIAFVH